MSREKLTNDIWRACDILRRDNNCGGVMEYVEHLSWLLFLKFLDGQEDIFAREAKQAKRSYTRIISGQYRWSDWVTKALGKKGGRRTIPEWDGNQLMRFVRGELIHHLASLSGSPEREVIAGIFGDRNVIVCDSPNNLKDVLKIIDEIDLTNPDDIYTVSHVYEDLLKRLGSENKMAGEFYTPRPVIRFMVEVIDPQIGETVYDPACGTCGFLVEAFLHMQKQEKTPEDREILERKTFVGQEKKLLPALLGTMNMVLHGVLVPDIRRRNTLAENVRDVSELFDVTFDVVLTNPPFGGKENVQIQQNFPVKASATELLFLEHIMKKLKSKSGARCGMVVPEGTLFRDGAFAAVKKELLHDFNLFMVVSLPPGTFAPYSDVKTALLFFERSQQYKEVLYQEITLPDELKRFSKANLISDEHFAEARKNWQQMNAYRQGKTPRPKITETCWLEDVETLAQRGYDLRARNPKRTESENFPHPAELTARILENNRKFQTIMERLHKMVSEEEA
ncbi:type I restriction-modification system subunit M [Phormidium nigroviride]